VILHGSTPAASVSKMAPTALDETEPESGPSNKKDFGAIELKRLPASAEMSDENL
jgi:hypothetical protein